MPDTEQLRLFTWDEAEKAFKCPLDGPGHPVVRCRGFAELEKFLDWLDNRSLEEIA